MGFNLADPFGILDFAKDQYAANRDYGHTRELFDSGNMFTERMSSTAYQRAVSDMSAAGLNPMLAYQQGGASSPGAAGAPAFSRGNSSAGSIHSAAQVDQLRAQTELTRAQTENVRAEKVGKESESGRLKFEFENVVPLRLKTAEFENAVKQTEAFLSSLEYNIMVRGGSLKDYSKLVQDHFQAKYRMLPAELRQRLAEASLKELAAKAGRAADSGYEAFKRMSGEAGEFLGKAQNSAVDAVRRLKHGYERFHSKAQYRRKYEFDRR